jgi:hypothetical protein
MDSKNSVIDLNKYINNKKYGDPEFRKCLLDLVKASYGTIDRGLLTLVESLEVDLDKHPENADKLFRISSHMISVSESLNEVFNTLESMLIDDKESGIK